MENPIKALRMEAGLSQERLALLADVDDSYISLLENGKRTATVPIAVRIADALSAELGRPVGVEELFIYSSSHATKTA